MVVFWSHASSGDGLAPHMSGLYDSGTPTCLIQQWVYTNAYKCTRTSKNLGTGQWAQWLKHRAIVPNV